MAASGWVSETMVVICLWVLLGCNPCCCTTTDVNCLKSIKRSLQDPLNYLTTSWNFNNQTEGAICNFAGVECWHDNENRVLNIKLSDMGLKGQFPPGIKYCSSLTGLDLSNNRLSGALPSNIHDILKYVTSLDLSSNEFSGEIPESLSDCTYLNVLNLKNNRFSGPIPAQLVQLTRLKTFSVANNLLSGPVPAFSPDKFSVDSYTGNRGLCGPPLNTCGSPSGGPGAGVIAGAAIGGLSFAAIVVAVGMFFYLRRPYMKRKKKDDPDGNKWAKSLKGTKGIKVSMFEKSVSKMKFNDLMKATNSFNKENVIGSGRTGAFYRGVLDDGTFLMVKRLQHSERLDKEFASEMETLGKAKHHNLVPLLGFCMAKKERLLVYKYMSNGTLHDYLHVDERGKEMEWPLRLKVGIGAAKGLAWLHHNCNPRIIHRNISSKCILLDVDFEPKISDFGLARLMNPIDTHLSTFVNGEFGDLGYVAPEYARTLVATPKGDVYSFGVVLLELVTGERPTDVAKASENFKGSLVEWITELSNNSQLEDAIDKCLVGKGVDGELLQFLKVACSCVLPAPKERPTMFEIYHLLRSIGQRYNFSVEDELTMLSETSDVDNLEELIVSREAT